MRGRRLIIALFLWVLLGAGPAQAGFGMSESSGLWRMASVQPLPSKNLRLRLLNTYYYQDVGLGSRFAFFQPRLDIGFGFGGFLEFGAGFSAWQRHRSVSTLDGQLWLGTQGSDWSGGLGAGDLSIKLSPPLPWNRLRLAGQANFRLPFSGGAPGPEPGGRDLELRALLELRLAEGIRFPKTWISLMAGRRLNRGEEGSGLPASAIPDDPWSPFPTYYPVGESSELDQTLAGLALRFQSGDTELFGEGVFVAYHPNLGMDLRENLWQLAFGFRTGLPRNFQLLLVVDMNLSRDNFDTEFEPHVPRVVQTLGISRDWEF